MEVLVMILNYGNMWTAWEAADLFLITANATVVKSTSALVMDKGIAREAYDRFYAHRVDTSLGKIISTTSGKPTPSANGVYLCYSPYYLIVSPKWPAAKLGAFQVREWFDGRPDEMIISFAVGALIEWISRAREVLGRDPAVHLNCPGIGRGKMHFDDVLVHISRLPDCVTIWQRIYQRPEPDIPLPPDHPLAILRQVGRDEFADSILAGMGEAGLEAFRELYNGVARDFNGRLTQWVTVDAYLDLANSGDELAGNHCWGVGRGMMAQLRRRFPTVARD
jgi:hypothetical protein